MKEKQTAKWIWCRQNDLREYNQAVLFKKEVELKAGAADHGGQIAVFNAFLLADAGFGLWNRERFSQLAPNINLLKIALLLAVLSRVL